MADSAPIELIELPPGRVTLSDRRTERVWSVELRAYRLAAVPVTRALYAAVAGEPLPAVTNEPLPAAEDGLLPVVGVTWWEAVRFCNALSERDGLAPAYRLDAEGDHVDADAVAGGYRLPTEAEWEYACRAGTAGPRYGPLDEVAWYRGNSGERIHEVGGKRPNAWGLYDMLGNTWDWCWDIYDAQVYGDYRVLRGGGWFDEHWSCRASVRRRSHPDTRLDDVGFRLARSAPR